MTSPRILTLVTLSTAAAAAPACVQSDTSAPIAATCAEYKAATGTTIDYEYDLYLDHDPARKWTAFCSGMAGDDPVEYLPLRRTGANDNFAEVAVWTDDPADLIDVVRTRFDAVRIDTSDPNAVRIDVGDRDHARSDPAIDVDGTIDGVGFGVAAACNPLTSGMSASVVARASIDLAGTHFVIDAFDDDRCVESFDTPNLARITRSTDRGRFDMTATFPDSLTSATGCVFAVPADPCPARPWLPDTDGYLLPVRYAP